MESCVNDRIRDLINHLHGKLGGCISNDLHQLAAVSLRTHRPLPVLLFLFNLGDDDGARPHPCGWEIAQPLGRPHDGPDVAENILCLCPNHHVLFDNGAFAVADDLRLLEMKGALRVHPKHRVEARYLVHHRARFGYD